MEPPDKILELLPSKPAKWALWLSVSLSTLLYALLLWLQVDKLLPLEVSQRLSILLPSAALLLIGSLFVLFFVVQELNNKKIELEKLKKAIRDYVPPPSP